MVATTTHAAASANGKESPRRLWTPDGTDHLIFQWVKMEGKTQGWVATQLGISQATVSRVVQRYERWQAHVEAREGGRLDHAERLRAQRWLTFERNEVLLASCLRIAQEMEGFTDVSKSKIRRGASVSQELEVSTQHATIDRSGVAARFLRLAFRINMEQLKLAELDPPPPAEPLSGEELADQEREAAAAAKEIAAARSRQTVPSGEDESRPLLPEGASNRQAAHFAEGHCAPSDSTDGSGSARQAEPTNTAEPIEEPAPTTASLHNLHNLHNADAPEIGANAAEPCSCVPRPRTKKFGGHLHHRRRQAAVARQ